MVRSLRRAIPGATVGLDAPAKAGGRWFVDLQSGPKRFVIEFRPGLGFGLSSASGEDPGYGEGPDEFLPDAAAVTARVLRLLQTGRRTEPQRVRLLRELRTRRKVAQTTIATRLGIRQPTVSKMERREDLSLGTLRRFIEALGGKLQVTAQFADECVEIGPSKMA
ncbi:MAG TPA: XRE family transcriptional regulator [Polyangia bacterium]|nr:XRE family transcriptional regulator [Polyangia bacterium]